MKVDIYKTAKKYNIIYADPPWQYDNMKNNSKKLGITDSATRIYEEIKRIIR